MDQGFGGYGLGIPGVPATPAGGGHVDGLKLEYALEKESMLERGVPFKASSDEGLRYFAIITAVHVRW